MLTIIIVASNLIMFASTISAIVCLIGADLGMKVGAFVMISLASAVVSYSANLIRNAINGID